jgi:hypothetical protein
MRKDRVGRHYIARCANRIVRGNKVIREGRLLLVTQIRPVASRQGGEHILLECVDDETGEAKGFIIKGINPVKLFIPY